MLLASNNIQLEVIGGHSSKLKRVIKRLNGEWHTKSNTGPGSQSTLTKKYYYFQGIMLHSSSVVPDVQE